MLQVVVAILGMTNFVVVALKKCCTKALKDIYLAHMQ